MTTTPFTIEIRDGAEPPAFLTDSDRRARWTVDRDLWAPRTVRVLADGELVAAALTAGRRYTAIRKIIDVATAPHAESGIYADSYLAALTAARDDRPEVSSERPAPLVIRFEEHSATAPLGEVETAALAAAGFTRDVDAFPSVPSTRPDTPEFTRSWSHWLGAAPTRPARYFGQTTDVTCGAVTSLMMLEAEGLGRFGEDSVENHGHELALWRRATNLPACEPIGLAVMTDEEAPERTPRVILSAEGPVLLEWYEDPHEIRLRIQLQEESLRQAEQRGISVERRWIEVQEIHDLVAAGADVFLLIALEPLIADPAPHWVLAHDAVDGHLIVSDPWVESEHGESWVDTAAQPMPLETVDLITRWGDPEYRGVIVIPR